MSPGSDPYNSRFMPKSAFLPVGGEYSLLPFHFIKLDQSRYVLTNFAGEYIVTDRDVLVRLVKKSLHPDSDIYAQFQSRVKGRLIADHWGGAKVDQGYVGIGD